MGLVLEGEWFENRDKSSMRQVIERALRVL